MKALIQRVSSASVTVNGEIISSIQNGLCVFIGISNQDTKKDLDYIVNKILKLKIFDDEKGKKWNRSVVEKSYEILCVSQFTLYHSLKGNKLDFHNAMPATSSKPFYEEFLQIMKETYSPELIKDGRFGAFMEINLVNDGPVTIQLESPRDKSKTEIEVEES